MKPDFLREALVPSLMVQRIMKIHENHDPDFMTAATTGPAGWDIVSTEGRVPAPTTPQEGKMTWETPTAIDFRFGFEITMYIAAR